MSLSEVASYLVDSGYDGYTFDYATTDTSNIAISINVDTTNQMITVVTRSDFNFQYLSGYPTRVAT